MLKGTGRTVQAVGFSADGRSIAWGHSVKSGWSPNDYGPLELAMRLPSASETLSQPERLPAAVETPSQPAQPKSDDGWILPKATNGALTLQHRRGGTDGYDALLDILKDGKPILAIIE